MSLNNSCERTDAAKNKSNEAIEKLAVEEGETERATWSNGADFFFSALGYAGIINK